MKDNSKGNQKNGIILTIVLLLILIVAVVGVTYAAFTWNQAGTKTNTITTGSIECTFTEASPINITAAHPISDNTGKTLAAGTIAGYTQGYSDAVLSCECSGESCSGNYELYVTDKTASNNLSLDYVKVYLTDGNDGSETAIGDFGATPTPVFSGLTASTVDGAKKLDSGSLTFADDDSDGVMTASKKWRLRVWVSDQYTVPNSTTAANFSALVKAKVTG